MGEIDDTMRCQNCNNRDAVDNEFNYILCEECLAYYLGIEIEELAEMTDAEQEMYWKLYEEENKTL